jgi:hypothetical protein
MPARSSKSLFSFSQGSNLRLSPFSRASASPAFSLSCQKSAAAVRCSIPAISLFSVSGSKTPPGLVDARPEGLYFLFELS